MKIKTNLNLIFLHIPKNGGTTLHSILERIYPPEKTFSIKVIDNIRLNTTDFINLPLDERGKIKLLKGHMLFGLHQYLVGESKYITFLRKPEDRLLSFYHYVKKRPQHRLYDTIFGKGLSFDDFIREVDAGDLHNAQIRWISGLEKGNEQDMLSIAKENIENQFVFVGIQEKYNTSLMVLKNKLKWRKITYEIKNKGSYKEKKLSIETIKIIKEKNKGDYELYDFALKKLKKQFKISYYLDLFYFNFYNYYINSIFFKSTKMKLLRKKLLR